MGLNTQFSNKCFHVEKVLQCCSKKQSYVLGVGDVWPNSTECMDLVHSFPHQGPCSHGEAGLLLSPCYGPLIFSSLLPQSVRRFPNQVYSNYISVHGLLCQPRLPHALPTF